VAQLCRLPGQLPDIGVIWLNHHRVFTQVARVDGPLLVLNLNLLL